MSFRALTVKELRELLMEKSVLIGILIMPLIIFPLLGMTMRAGASATERAQQGFEALVLDMDGGWASQELIQTLSQGGVRLKQLSSGDDVEKTLAASDIKFLILIPPGFTHNISIPSQASLQIYYRLERPSVFELQTLQSFLSLVSLSSTILGERLAERVGIDARFYRSPLTLSQSIVYRGEIFEVGSVAFLPIFYLSTILPLGIFIISITAGTVSATSLGMEKEAKTLEILLTLPVNRIKLLAAKLLSSVFLAILGGASFTLGFLFYFQGVMSIASESSEASFQAPSEVLATFYNFSITTFILLGVVIVVSLVLTLAIGILAGILAGDVRGGQQLASLLLALLFLPPFILQQFTSFSMLEPTTQILMMLNPVTHIFLAFESAIASDYFSILVHLTVTTFYIALLLGIAAWIFSGERLISLRIKLGRGIGLGLRPQTK
ncbi:MAG: ABC transporter permease subunit [Nitrososphaerota archaeon]